MKRFIVLAVICIVLISCGTVSITASDQTPPADGQVKCTAVTGEAFDAFYSMVQTSETSIYDIDTKEWEVYETRPAETEKGIYQTEYIYYSGNGVLWETPVWSRTLAEGSEWRIGIQAIGTLNTETIACLGQAENIKAILAENNINCTVKDYAVLSVDYFTDGIIWVDTDQGYYYIQMCRAAEAEREAGQNQYVYKVYTPSVFLEKLDARDAKILVNGQNTPAATHYAKIRGNTVSVSLRSALETMGAVVSWDEANQTILFSYQNVLYQFSVPDESGGAYLYIRKDDGVLEPVYAGKWLWYYMLDGRTIVNAPELQVFSRLFGKQPEIDFDQLTIDFVNM